MTMFPPRATSYQGAYLSPAADLYGPFWTLTTLIFALFVCSSLSSAIASWLSNPAAAAHIVYDFSLIFTGTSLVYAYGLLVPVLLWFGLRYLGVGEWSVVDAVAIWGYGQFVWIPVAVCASVLVWWSGLAEPCAGALRYSHSHCPVGRRRTGRAAVGVLPDGQRVSGPCVGACLVFSSLAISVY